MPARLRVPLLAICLLASAAAPGRAQLTPDTGFEPRVTRPAFAAAQPRVLFDAGHFNMFTMRDRYAPLARLARADGWRLSENTDSITRADLAGAKLLVIADPLGGRDPMDPSAERPAFSQAECDAIVEWVSQGGGLLLVAEHAPTGLAARGLAGRLGVDLSAGFLTDPALQDSTIGGSTLLFSRASGTIGDHPIMRGRNSTERVSRVKTFTGESIAGPEGSVSLLKVTARARDNLVRVGTPPGPIPDSLQRSAAGRAQAIAFTLGKGRVVVLGDGMMLAAAIMLVTETKRYGVGMSADGVDNRGFALNVLRWLGGALN